MHSNNFEISVVVPVSGSPERMSNIGTWFKNSPSLRTEVIFVEDSLSAESKNFLNLQINQFPQGIEVKKLECDFQNPGSTRNLGLSVTSGNLVVFWDCDDIPNFSEVEDSLINLNSDSWDYICGDFIYYDQSRNLEINSKFPVKREFKNSDGIVLEPGLWRYIFKKNLIADISFPNLRMGEDQVFLGMAIKPCSKGVYLEKIFYKYRINITNQLTSTKENLIDLKTAINLLGNIDSRYKNRFTNQMRIKMLFTLILRGSVMLSLWALVVIFRIVISERQLKNSCFVLWSIIFQRRSP